LEHDISDPGDDETLDLQWVETQFLGTSNWQVVHGVDNHDREILCEDKILRDGRGSMHWVVAGDLALDT
jgi:hypothetical protein